jgi:hypothetical protein
MKARRPRSLKPFGALAVRSASASVAAALSGGAVVAMALDRGTMTSTSMANVKRWLRCV